MNNALAIRDLQIHLLDVPLAAPFTTSSSALEVLSNVALCIEPPRKIGTAGLDARTGDMTYRPKR